MKVEERDTVGKGEGEEPADKGEGGRIRSESGGKGGKNHQRSLKAERECEG